LGLSKGSVPVSHNHAGVKRKTFYHLCLALPYIALTVSGAFTYFTNGLDLLNGGPPASLTVLSGMLIFFTVSAIIWGPLYTWMVLVMLLWGRGKSANMIRRLYHFSPLLLAGSMGVPAIIIGIPDSGPFLLWGFLRMNHLDFVMPVFFINYYHEQALGTTVSWVFMAATSVVIGYAFVGVALLIERALQRRNLFIEENVERVEN
jgi:hypothetical protein